MTSKQLVDLARKRLADHGLAKEDRRLISLTNSTRNRLITVAKVLSKHLGYTVFPMHVAALIVEEGVKELEAR